MNPKRKLLLLFLLMFLAVLSSGLLGGCSAKEAGGEHAFPMSHLEGAPAEVLNAPADVLDAYAFAVANPEIMKELPCYCGCGAMGHTSNYGCYVSAVDASGNVTYDTHALGCSICVDITLDAMRMLKQGKALPEIRAFVDDSYARYGPSNLP
jgi:hypothetical protein